MGILRRTVFVDLQKGRVLFHDFNLVNTTLGAMMEPRQLNDLPIAGSTKYSPPQEADDEMRRIDEVVHCPVTENRARFKFLHGGTQIPRGYMA